jgi:dephospho-CoA kinase
MLRVALTGGIGSGKSETGEILGNLGAIVIDSDELAKTAVERGNPAFNEIIEKFGDFVLSNGDLDRKKLADLVFSDEAKRKSLEAIIHPRVRKAFEEIVENLPGDSIVVNQIPILVETKGEQSFDYVITVVAPMELRRERLRERGMKDFEIERRILSQVSDKEREQISDYIIDNSGDRESLLRQVEEIYKELKKHASYN